MGKLDKKIESDMTIEMANVMIDYLNELCELDLEAMDMLIGTRVPCNGSLANHPTVQVLTNDSEQPVVGILGILNGLIGANENGWGYICAEFDKKNKLVGFKLTNLEKNGG